MRERESEGEKVRVYERERVYLTLGVEAHQDVEKGKPSSSHILILIIPGHHTAQPDTNHTHTQ